MRLLLCCIMLFCLPNTGICNDGLSIVVKQVDVMTGATGKYVYSKGKIKVYLKKDNRKIYWLKTCKRTDRIHAELIDSAIMKLVNNYAAQSTSFSSHSFDGLSWSIIVNLGKGSLEYRVDNCYNSYFDEIISLLNRELKRNRIISETGNVFNFKDRPCE